MPAAFVHGVPETPAVWGPLVENLERDDLILLQLPGFGCPLPDGFEPDMESYADWLAREIAGLDGPVDLVSHDWGAILTLRLLSTRPGNIRSWVVDFGNLEESFEWHDMAKLWQTPGEGEAFFEGVLASSPTDQAALLEGAGVPAGSGARLAEGLDETMAAAILALYRSATTIGSAWGPGIDLIEGSGLVVDAPQDPFRREGSARALAERTGAATASPEGAGHWWMLSHPQDSAAILAEFWAGID